MKDLLKRSAYSPSVDNPPITDYPPPPQFYRKILTPPSIIFQKYQPPINKGEGVQTLNVL